MTDLEDALTRTLARAATRAPAARPDLLGRVAARHAERRRRGLAAIAVAAAVAVAVVAGSTVTLVRLTAGPDLPVTRPSPTTGTGMPPAITKVWPKAVRTAPEKLPNGRYLYPQLLLDDHTLLATTLKDDHADRLDGLWTYDMNTGEAGRLARVTTPPGTSVTASYLSIGDGHIGWWTYRREGGHQVVRIWTVPVTGGTPRQVAVLRDAGATGIDMAIGDGKVVWSVWGKDGVHQVPLDGKRPALVPGTEKYYLFQWPWASYPRVHENEPFDVPIGEHLLDLRTGRTVGAVTRPGERGVVCAITWCLTGRTARHRDGSGERALPGQAMPSQNIPLLDRFLMLERRAGTTRGGVVLYDLTSGRSADLGIRSDKRGAMAIPTFDHRLPGMFSYRLGGRFVIVNLAAID
ncbi:TolB-like translocation protein [Sphaerisporangium corydalis]|uniref:WD40 repeat domain-containing protein n=1 Tax=Sphaerisporangium corydalis TaxID=1441875 RepID=A0ABV9EAQ2_9ACTN|nr:hypothetical protein [Sphaerisporangium corydalis]